MFIDKLKIMWSLLRSRAWVVLTDKKAVVNIPTFDLDKFEDIMMLAAQTAALTEFQERLEEIIKEHEATLTLLEHRKKGKK